MRVAKTKALISFAVTAKLPLFSHMQIVGFPMRRLIWCRDCRRERDLNDTHGASLTKTTRSQGTAEVVEDRTKRHIV